MEERHQHSRRAFLQGKAALRTVANQLLDMGKQWADTATELIANRVPSSLPIHVEATRRAMACDFSVRYHDADRHLASLMLDAFDQIEAIESRLTIYRATSEVIELNRRAADCPVTVSSELFELVEMAEKLYSETAGAFDITGTPLSRVWGFFQRAAALPSDDDIAQAIATVGMPYVTLNRSANTIGFTRPGVEINFNAIGKGYALDRIAEMLATHGASDYLWHGGRSSILARGSNHGDDHQCWSVGLQHPLEPSVRLGEFHLRDRALGTSGGATQGFEHQGQRYSHILDPRTGWPANGVYTATVVANSAAEADALSTAAFVLGPEEIGTICSRRPDVGIVLVCPSDTELGITVFTGNLATEDWTPRCDPRMITTL